MQEQFELGYDIQRLVSAFQFETGEVIKEQETLVILDEIQECPKALTSLKYFCEEAPGLAVTAAGSLLGITIHGGTGYPVGKVNALDLYPMSFREFLAATGNAGMSELVASNDPAIIDSFAGKITPLLRQYYYVGGMPEAAAAFLERGLLEETQGPFRTRSSVTTSATSPSTCRAQRPNTPSRHGGRFRHISAGRTRSSSSATSPRAPARGTTNPASPGSNRQALSRRFAGSRSQACRCALARTTPPSSCSCSTSARSGPWCIWTRVPSLAAAQSSRSSRVPSPSSTSASSWCRSAGSRRTTGPPRTRRAR